MVFFMFCNWFDLVCSVFEHYFEKILGASDTKFDKPNRAPVDLILTAINIGTGPEVWFVGDTDIDMECAYNSKCTPVLLSYLHMWCKSQGQFKIYSVCKQNKLAQNNLNYFEIKVLILQH